MKSLFSALMLLAACGSVSLCVSCAGVKCRVKADQIEQPVSFTPCVFDESGNIVKANGSTIKTHFELKKCFWAMLWRNYSLTPSEWDLSEELKRELAQANGDAIVNLTVKSEDDGMLWFVSSLAPIIPDFHTIVVEGDVARFKPGM